jgi:succinylglutamic semialdehyde dehydrogenase
VSAILRSFDPATGAVVWEGEATSEQGVQAAVDRARKTARSWALLPPRERVGHARRYAEVLGSNRDSLAELISRETGKPLWDSQGEVAAMIGKVELSIKAQAERAGEQRTGQPFGEAVLRHRPHGVVAVLGPYNFPAHLPNGHIVPALLAGNTVVFKPSEQTAAVGEAMAELWSEAGVPEGVLNVVQGGRDTGAALVAADIDGLFCTGSAATGAQLRRVFADRPHVILALELGGNNPLVAWDGEPEALAAIVAESAFITAGQRCSCARRLIVPDDAIGAATVKAVVDLAQRLRVGAWNDPPEPFMGPLISSAAADAARAQVAVLVAGGARELTPMPTLAGRGAAFMAPVVLDATGTAAPDEEIFAPVLQVHRVRDFAAAIELANHTRFGLSAGLLSADNSLWKRFVGEIRAGVVNRNRPTTGASGAMPFGGLGESGNHRPSAYYAADYCAYPVASFEAPSPAADAGAVAGRLQP